VTVLVSPLKNRSVPGIIVSVYVDLQRLFGATPLMNCDRILALLDGIIGTSQGGRCNCPLFYVDRQVEESLEGFAS
jgi:hypothetical protein